MADTKKLDAVYKDRVALDREEIVKQTKELGLANHQIDALLAVKYQYGNIAGVKEAWILSDNGKDLEKFKESFWVNTQGGGTAYPFVENGSYNNRKRANWKLFSEGIYTDSSGRVLYQGGDIMAKAEEIHTWMEQNSYIYGHANGGGTPEGMRNQRQVNCISFVTWVYCEAGYIDEIYTSCSNFESQGINGKYAGKFKKVTNYNDLQPGDIMYFDGHAEIYVGPNQSYNAGTTRAIQGDGYGWGVDISKFKYGFTVK